MDRVREIATKTLESGAASAVLGESIMSKPLLRISPNISTAMVVAGDALAGVGRQAAPTDESPGVITVGEVLEELGAAIRRWSK